MGAGPTMVDASFSKPTPASVKAAGVEVVMLYLSPDPRKNATPALVKAYHAQGVGVLLGWEWYATRATEGATAGTADGDSARDQARALFAGVGHKPRNRVNIYHAVDFDTNPSQYPAIDAYLRAAGRELHAAGLGVADYAEFDVVEHEHAAGITDADWQTYAWSGGKVSKHIAALQYLNGQRMGGADVDLDTIVDKAALGAWWPKGHPLDVPESNSSTVGGLDMTQPIPQAQLDQIAKAVTAEVWNHTEKIGGLDRRMGHAVSFGSQHAYAALGKLDDLAGQSSAIVKALTEPGKGALARVAAAQAAIAKVEAAVAAIKPAQAVVDAAAIADAVAAKLGDQISTKVVAAVRALTFGAKG